MNEPIITELDVSNEPEFDNHRAFAFENYRVGLLGFTAIHKMVKSSVAQSRFGVDKLSDGGSRVYLYQNEDEAIVDVLRLSKGMTYKAALAGLDGGGGKTVIIGDPRTIKTKDFLRAYGETITLLNEKYLIPQHNGVFMTGEDSGISPEDVDVISETAPQYVFGTTKGAGDPSPMTAMGVIAGIEQCLHFVYGDKNFKGRSFAVQGVGRVGWPVANEIYKRGGTLYVSETNAECRAKFAQMEWGMLLPPDFTDFIHAVDADVFVPCAMGAILNDVTISQMRCKIIAGSANNQLQKSEHTNLLQSRGILYAPDFVTNAGGLIHVYHERYPGGYNSRETIAHVLTIPQTLQKIFEKSREENISTHEAAMIMANEILATKEMAWR